MEWKKSISIPIHKNGTYDYRVISLLSREGKVTETALDFMVRRNYSNHWFRKGRGIDLAILRTRAFKSAANNAMLS